MTTQTLSIVISGAGDDAHHRSHWSFLFHAPSATHGNLFQVSLLDRDRLWYNFDRRDGVALHDPSSEGHFHVASLPGAQYARARTIISEEPPPRDGTERCQDWTLNCVVALEAEELVEAGISELVAGLVGRSAEDVARCLGDRWVACRRG